MKVKITIQNLADKGDHGIEILTDAVIVFTGKITKENNKTYEVEHGIAYSGNKQIMADVLRNIPEQILGFIQEEMKNKNEPKIVASNGKDVEKN